MVIPSLEGRVQVGKTAGKGLLENRILDGTVHPRMHPILASLHRWFEMVARADPAWDTSQGGAGGAYEWLVACGNLR
ncbi:hypothetical protein CDL15_Pgr014202 [Punica granatum]|uniref:Uncharacterized protein n=1 Tax=Punica granatum TaxID=22663 RepID=A0A218XCQ1_PUNGR|nr:hypothetical protein CDL15_Pgr014202 [Punica granatum]PKI31583.1 hypothetical protein CRG98_048026 [Punica granatum]